MYCPKCGTRASTDDQYCGSCGGAISAPSALRVDAGRSRKVGLFVLVFLLLAAGATGLYIATSGGCQIAKLKSLSSKLANTPEAIITQYIEAYLESDLVTLTKLDASMHENISGAIRRAPSTLRDEQYNKALKEQLDKIRSEEDEKRERKTDLKNGLNILWGGGRPLLSILYPGMSYQISDVQAVDSGSMAGMEGFTYSAFLEVKYANPANAPLDSGWEIKKTMVKVFLRSLDGGSQKYVVSHYAPTDFGKEHFSSADYGAATNRLDILNANIDTVRFFPCSYSFVVIPPNERKYSKIFGKDTKCVDWELNMRFPATRKPIEMNVQSLLYGPAGNCVAHWTTFISVSAGWDNSTTWSAFEGGFRQTGQYTLDLVVKSTKIASSTFSIVDRDVPVQSSESSVRWPFEGTVVETMNAGGYTYVLVSDGKNKIWGAGPQITIREGDAVTLPAGMPMQNYVNKEMNRKFELIYFVGAIGK